MIFAFIHLFLLLGILILAFYSLFQGNVLRFAIIIALLTVYYFIALHKNVMEEIKRKKKKGKKKKK
jgi:Ca2+/Na+ antiporter